MRRTPIDLQGAQDLTGYDYVHSAIDAHSRLAFSEIHADERGPTCAGFWERAVNHDRKRQHLSV
jgi:hypothetical protein